MQLWRAGVFEDLIDSSTQHQIACQQDFDGVHLGVPFPALHLLPLILCTSHRSLALRVRNRRDTKRPIVGVGQVAAWHSAQGTGMKEGVKREKSQSIKPGAGPKRRIRLPRKHSTVADVPSPQGSARAIEPSEVSADEAAPITSRADGFYWLAPDGHQEFGPFETYELARSDRDRFDDIDWTPGETLQEAESEIGISAWIDPDTGEPAEGPSPPHLEQD
jgi:hypothetical protein